MKEYGLFLIEDAYMISNIINKFPNFKSMAKVENSRLHVPKDMPLYLELLEYLKSQNYHYYYNERVEFSKKEYNDAELLNFSAYDINDWGYEKGTQYEVIAGCEDPACYKVRKQISILHLDTKKMGNRDCSELLSREIVVSKRFRDLSVDNNLTGCKFEPVINGKSGEVSSEYFQLTVENVLPEFSSQFKRETFICPNCKTIVQVQRDWTYIYDKNVLSQACDFNITNEIMSVTYPSHEYIFSKKVYQLVKQHKLKGTVFVPVTFI